jgi:guanylate kinase
MNKKGRLIIISAPSGAGKGTVIREVTRLRPEIKYSVSATTRAPRPGEVNGEHYYFVDAAEFDAMAARGEFLEHESYVGNSYGTPRGPIERNMDEGIDTILEIEVKGARQVREKIPDVISIFLAVPDEEELHRRLTGRGKMDEAELESRIQTAREELAAAEEYTFTVVNDDAERAAREIIAILDFNREDYL